MKQVLFFLFIILCLPGCRLHPYHKKNGKWYFNDTEITIADNSFKPLTRRFAKDAHYGYFRGDAIGGSDAKSFEGLGENYAKDKLHVYYCNTYLDSKYLFMERGNRIRIVEGADPASFEVLSSSVYGKDKSNVYCETAVVPVKDVESYEVLDYDYSHDKITGYYLQSEIAGSDGKTFSVIGNHFAKDKNNIYYSTMINLNTTAASYVVKDADGGSFVSLGDDYALDKHHVYYGNNSLPVTGELSFFHVLSIGYAKNGAQVFYNGKLIDADASSFKVKDNISNDADAEDKNGNLYEGRRVK